MNDIELQDVHFTYPTRPDIPILTGLGVRVERGKTLALVGSSGCGKSTIVSLLERFYDAKNGRVVSHPFFFLDLFYITVLNSYFLIGNAIQSNIVCFSGNIIFSFTFFCGTPLLLF